MYSITLEPIKILHTDRYSTWHFRCHAIPAEIVGIEVTVRSEKTGRVEDHLIQLQLADEPIGHNRANRDTAAVKVYGSNDDMWGCQLTFADINRVSVMTQYLCSVAEPRGSITVDTVSLTLHYRALGATALQD